MLGSCAVVRWSVSGKVRGPGRTCAVDRIGHAHGLSISAAAEAPIEPTWLRGPTIRHWFELTATEGPAASRD